MSNEAFLYIAKSLLRMFLRLRKQGRIGNIERTPFFRSEVAEVPEGYYAVVVVELRQLTQGREGGGS